MNVNLREEETTEYLSVFKAFIEDISQLNKKVLDVQYEVLQQAQYEQLQQYLFRIIDVYEEVVINNIDNGVLFSAWTESKGSLRACLRTYKAGDSADEVCAQIELTMGDLMLDALKIGKIDAVITARPIVTENGIEKLEEICRDARGEIQDIKENYIAQAESKSTDNEIYGTLISLFVGVAANLEVFFEAAQKGFEDLHEFLNTISVQLKNVVEEKSVGESLNTINNTSSENGFLTKEGDNDDAAKQQDPENIDLDPSDINPLLTNNQVEIIRRETGWSDVIISYLRSMAEYQIYRDANLREIVIGDTRALIRRDLNWEQKDKKGLTNAQRIQKGRAPLDENGISIELHHIGQHIDSPLAELTRDDHRGKGNDTILHDKSISSEAHGEGNAWDKERVGFWKERDVFNNFYREKFEPELIRIGQDRTSSVAERIKKIQELFSNAKYKRDINAPVDVQYVTGFHDDGTIIYEWPPKLGFSDFEPISREKKLPIHWDRYGHLGGSNFASIPDTGKYSYSERAIPYVENEEAYHFGEFNNKTYFDKIDAIKSRDFEKLNKILESEGVQKVSEEFFEEMCDDYDDFISDTHDNMGEVDATYGLQGTAAAWGDMICGAKQYVTPLNGETLRRLGALIERK